MFVIVAEILLIHRLLQTHGLAFFIVPFLSIVVEKTAYLKRVLRGSPLLVQGLHQGSRGLSPSCNICVCTIERANGLINRMIEMETISRLSCVICDELQLVGEDRGQTLECLLTKLMFCNESV